MEIARKSGPEKEATPVDAGGFRRGLSGSLRSGFAQYGVALHDARLSAFAGADGLAGGLFPRYAAQQAIGCQGIRMNLWACTEMFHRGFALAYSTTGPTIRS